MRQFRQRAMHQAPRLHRRSPSRQVLSAHPMSYRSIVNTAPSDLCVLYTSIRTRSFELPPSHYSLAHLIGDFLTCSSTQAYVFAMPSLSDTLDDQPNE